MYKDEDLVMVRNRNAGTTRYTLDDGRSRFFEYNEVKKVPFGELKQLSYSHGGQGILSDCLVIEDKNALEFLNMNVEPEYFYSDEEIKKILLEGTLDQLEDTLNFAPEGVIELIKKIGFELEIFDVRKRDLIAQKTGFNISNAINIKHQLEVEENKEAATEAPKRKTAPIEVNNSAPVRKTVAPDKYKVVEKK